MTEQPLTAEDYESVRAAVSALGQHVTLNGQVEAWSSFVASVEEGYRWSVYEYTNDLSVRSWLDRARGLVTERVRRSLDVRLEPLDARFRTATRQSERVPGDMWWCREPVRLVGELATDLSG